MPKDEKAAKRTVVAPSPAAPTSEGEVLSVDVGPDEDVEWVWSHDRKHGSRVTGYRIVTRNTEG